MTAEEEAAELVMRYYMSHYTRSEEFDKELAKQCALIAIEFAADQFDKYCLSEMGLHWTKDDQYTDGSKDHFRYIKEGVEKL